MPIPKIPNPFTFQKPIPKSLDVQPLTTEATAIPDTRTHPENGWDDAMVADSSYGKQMPAQPLELPVPEAPPAPFSRDINKPAGSPPRMPRPQTAIDNPELVRVTQQST